MTKAERLEAEIKRTELMKEFDREYKIYGCLLYTSPSPRD